MRTLNERFTDEEFARLKRKKGDRSWHDAILEEFGATQEAIMDGGEGE